MGALVIYLGILATVILGFQVLGLVEDTGISSLLNLASDPSNFFTNLFYLNLSAILTLVGTAAVVVGFLYNQRIDLAILIGFTSFLLSLAVDILTIYNQIKDNFTPDFAILLISPLLIIYFISVIEWWRGMN